jgi:hypothetical protein
VVYDPVTDIASLMRDAFLNWEEEVRARHHRALLARRRAGSGLTGSVTISAGFHRAVEWMGLQRHRVLNILRGSRCAVAAVTWPTRRVHPVRPRHLRPPPPLGPPDGAARQIEGNTHPRGTHLSQTSLFRPPAGHKQLLI